MEVIVKGLLKFALPVAVSFPVSSWGADIKLLLGFLFGFRELSLWWPQLVFK